MPICPRHGQESEIVQSDTGPYEAEPGSGTSVIRTVHTLRCGQDVTLPSGRTLFDNCAFTPQELLAYTESERVKAEAVAAKVERGSR